MNNVFTCTASIDSSTNWRLGSYITDYIDNCLGCRNATKMIVLIVIIWKQEIRFACRGTWKNGVASNGFYQCQSDGYSHSVLIMQQLGSTCIMEVNCDDTLNIVCGNDNLLPAFDTNQTNVTHPTYNELITMNFYDKQYGGVLCCRDYHFTNTPTNFPS